jgi:acetate kinase
VFKRPVLSINGGSSSIKYALYETEGSLTQLFSGEMERIDQENAAHELIDRLEKQDGFKSVKAIGHRIVHGMKHTAPERITPALLDELKGISAFDPEHMPGAITLIEVFGQRCPAVVQIACFDTSFHTSMPGVAQMLPLPRRYHDRGLQRYGFHGLSYAYLMEELHRVAGHETAQGRVILAHLGNGASLAAVKEGSSMDTSMGFTPVSGLPMSTRTGDLDPAVAWYLMQVEKLNPEQYSHLINHESGLLGISETSSDMRELLKSEPTDSRAAEAIELFCYQTKKWIGSFAAVLGGLDTLIFSGGIGENNPAIRDRVCRGLLFLGIELDETRNVKNEPIISTEASAVAVHVIRTNEELMMARLVCQVMNYTIK